MFLEQPAEFEHLLGPRESVWTLYRKALWPVLPLFWLTAAWAAGFLGLVWLRSGQFDFGQLGGVLVLVIMVPAAVFLVIWLNCLGARRGGRTLDVSEDGIGFCAEGRTSIKLKDVAGFYFENISGEPSLGKLTVLYFDLCRTKFPRRTSIILKKESQIDRLVVQLRRMRQRAEARFCVEMNPPPPPPVPHRFYMMSMSLVCAGLFLFLSGLPMLIAGAGLNHGGSGGQSDGDTRFTPQARARLAAFVHAHFSSPAEYRHFLLQLGIVLVVAGAALMIAAKWLLRSPRQPASGGLVAAH